MAGTDYGYDGIGRLVAMSHTRAGGSAVSAYGLGYDRFGRIARQSTPEGVSVFGYDDLDQVTAADLPGTLPDEGHGYSAAGNRTDAGYATGAHNLLASDGRRSFEYDAAGNRTAETDWATGERTEYEYDRRNRLVAATGYSAGGIATRRVEYGYDAFDRRVSRAVVLGGGVEEPGAERFVNEGEHIAVTLGGGGAVKDRYFYGPGTDQVLAIDRVGVGALWALTDHLGSVRDWLNTQGELRKHLAYSAFGRILSDSNPALVLAVSYTGREYDQVLKSYYYRARWYDPASGKFLSQDPLGFGAGDANLSRYVFNGPTHHTDPSGKIVPLVIGLVVAAAIGAAIGGGLNAARQGVQIAEGSRQEFDWGEVWRSALTGAVLAPVLVVAPELAFPLAVLGVANGLSEMTRGNYFTGLFDIATAVGPFGFKGVRNATFGKGTLFGADRGLGPAASLGTRGARFSEIGNSTIALTSRLWNQRFYRGTTFYEGLQTVENNGFDLAYIRDRQLNALAPPARGPGLYFTRTPGAPEIPGSAANWADVHGRFGRGGGPVIVEASIPRWRMFFLRRQPGVEMSVPQAGYKHPASLETYFPVQGTPGSAPGGPGVLFNQQARWRIWEGKNPFGGFEWLWPTLETPPKPS